MTNRPGLDAPRIDQGQESPEKEMKTFRQFSRLGPCAMLGPIVRETRTRIHFFSREGHAATMRAPMSRRLWGLSGARRVYLRAA
jgi:hypothetical protein